MITLTVYSRPDCHLCDVMLEELAPLVDGRAELRIVDISRDTELKRKYGLRIPVLCAGDDELCQYHLDARRVEHYLGVGPQGLTPGSDPAEL